MERIIRCTIWCAVAGVIVWSRSLGLDADERAWLFRKRRWWNRADRAAHGEDRYEPLGNASPAPVAAGWHRA